MAVRDDFVASPDREAHAIPGRHASPATGRGRRNLKTVVGAGVVAVLTLVACSSPGEPEGAPQAGSVTLDTSREPSSVLSQTYSPVYWSGADTQSQRLFRETLRVESPSTADPIETAVLAMTQAQPTDGDYRTLWRPVSHVGTSFTADTITIDLPSSAVSRHLEEAQARLAVQQVTHTAVAAAKEAGLVGQDADPGVRILVDGAGEQTVFGSYELPDAQNAEPGSLARLSLDQPAPGLSPGQVRFTGRFDSDLTDAVVTITRVGASEREFLHREHLDSAPAPARQTEVAVEADLDAGRYVITLTATDRDGNPVTDDHLFAVGAEADRVVAEG
ncbi:hypothetical protein FCK90_03740 [Kocuria coralli]|uniref:GerMN domain-containing protein n=1 Tax=Kocuria coralli TaxID=1461025 RepID=A0A5J5L232_9MICC|nr:GerMN domain-containing protein [Kocuria coralli]KAA9395031.1 hypothetical protein FCK90_03740 [Kocuria coralli]